MIPFGKDYTCDHGEPPDDCQTCAKIEQEQALHLKARIRTSAIDAYVKFRGQEDAKRRVQAEQGGAVDVPAPFDLAELLAMPVEPTKWRIEGLWPLQGNVILAAQYKGGKTTLVANLLRSLADGDRFLGIYPVDRIVDGTVALTDFEMPQRTLIEWLGAQGIRNQHLVKVWSMRGRGSAFDLLDTTIRAAWVEHLKAARTRTWLVDCLGPILSALGLGENENKEVGRVLDALTATATDAGVNELLLVHHMGHGPERSRGASRLRDWPDAEWRLVRQRNEDNPLGDPEPDAPRFFSAFGRDVNVREGQLVYDPDTRRVVYANGNRKEAKSRGAMVTMLMFIRDNPGASGRDIDAAADLAGVSRNDAREVRKTAVRKGYAATAPGPHRAQLHTLTAAGFAELRELTYTGGGK